MTERTRIVLTAAMILAITIGMTGCATTQSGSSKPAYTGQTGFLSDYSKLKLESGKKKVYINPDVDFSNYDKIMIDRITVWYKEDTEYKGIDPTELKALADYFHNAIAKAVEDAYPVVDKPGPGVMRVRISLTDLVPTKPEYSVAIAVIPYGSAADLLIGGKDSHPPYLGETAMEAEMLDSQTNEQLGAVVDRKLGKKLNVDTSEGSSAAVKKGVDGYLDAFSTWGYAQAAMDYWAQSFRKRLDGLRGK